MVTAGLLVWFEARRSRRDAAVLAGFMVVSNVLVQLVKHPGLTITPLSDIEPISGHVGVLGAAALGALLAATRRREGAVAVTAGTVLAATGLGVILAGWHTLPQVVCPLFIVSGCSLIASTVLTRSRESATNPPSPTRGRLVSALILMGAVAAVLTVASSRTSDVGAIVMTTAVTLVALSFGAVWAVVTGPWRLPAASVTASS
jgi:hypothetical protein